MYRQKINDFIKQRRYPVFNLKAAFFDMDGVLFDSMPAHAEAWVKAFESVEVPFTSYQAYMQEGRTGNGTIDDVFQSEKGRLATEEEKTLIYSTKSRIFEQIEAVRVMPFALPLLEKIKAHYVQIVLVTGSGQPSLLDRLEVYFPQIFERERMVTAFDVKKGKPHPEPYLMALEKAHVKPWEAVVVENAPLGIASASDAGIYTLAVNTGILENEVLVKAGANAIFSGVEDLYNQWNQLFFGE
ncbi:HAD family hydrolase [Microbacter margulisiae]|nr:HAD-IA family hydrolase [Microbacter margulisiae]